MTEEINVLSRTQIIIVEPTSGSVSVINAGPQGPAGPAGTGGGSSYTPPTGTVVMWAGAVTNIPPGWLVCDGSTPSRAAYPQLFAVIGTMYGPGDGVNTFTLPSMIDRMPRGGTPGSKGGALTHKHGLSAGYAMMSMGAIAGTYNLRESRKTGITPTWTSNIGNASAMTFNTHTAAAADGINLGGTTDDGDSLPPWQGFVFLIKT